MTWVSGTNFRASGRCCVYHTYTTQTAEGIKTYSPKNKIKEKQGSFVSRHLRFNSNTKEICKNLKYWHFIFILLINCIICHFNSVSCVTFFFCFQFRTISFLFRISVVYSSRESHRGQGLFFHPPDKTNDTEYNCCQQTKARWMQLSSVLESDSLNSHYLSFVSLRLIRLSSTTHYDLLKCFLSLCITKQNTAAEGNEPLQSVRFHLPLTLLCETQPQS